MTKLLKPISEAVDRTLDTLLPLDCCGCGEPVRGGPLRYLCELCFRAMDWILPPYCQRCGSPGPEECSRCVRESPAYGRCRFLFAFAGPGRGYAHDLKYRGARLLLRDLEVLVRSVPGFVEHLNGAILIPVPLHPRKRRKRGFNQSEWIAEALVDLAEGAEMNPVLERVRPTGTQTDLSRPMRRENVKNAFALRPRTRLDGERRYVVIDDVFTTGSTLEACVRALHAGGASEVDALALAHEL